MNRILIVDDELHIVEFLREVLEDEGYQVHIAQSGYEALGVVDKFQPHLIICDVMMPGMSGIELCRTLKDNPAYAVIPIVLMSAGVQVLRAEGCQYEQFLAKPFDIARMLKETAILLHRSTP